jgi:hypothetical protein
MHSNGDHRLHTDNSGIREISAPLHALFGKHPATVFEDVCSTAPLPRLEITEQLTHACAESSEHIGLTRETVQKTSKYGEPNILLNLLTAECKQKYLKSLNAAAPVPTPAETPLKLPKPNKSTTGMSKQTLKKHARVEASNKCHKKARLEKRKKEGRCPQKCGCCKCKEKRTAQVRGKNARYRLTQKILS